MITLEYQPPESNTFSIEFSADYWALSISIYTMLTNDFPFLSLESIQQDGIPDLKRPKISKEAKELIKNLLNRNQFEILGSIKNPLNVKDDLFFKEINWEKLEKGKIEPPLRQILSVALIL